MPANEPGVVTNSTVAVLDIGSNSVRMVIAEVFADGRIEILERTQRSVRLGRSTFVTGRLSQRTTNAAIAILKDYRKLIDTYRVRHVRAVATSAVREADNSDAFIDRVSIATDLDVEVIDPSEESRLTVSAVRHALGDAFSINKATSVIVEVGGGSSLLALLEHGEIAFSESYNLGSIRLQEILETTNEPPDRAAELLRHRINNVVAAIQRTTRLGSADCFVAIGGDARFAAKQVGRPTGLPETETVNRGDLDRLVAECSRHSIEDLMHVYGLSAANAETLVPALLTYQALLHASGADPMIVSHVSMRDGLLLDITRQVIGKEDPGHAQSVIQSARTLAEKYLCDPDHANHVAELCVQLFDEMKPDHRLGNWYRLLLHIAAILHETGGFVSSRAHHKHSYYVIANSEIFGLRRAERQIVAHVARYHRQSGPKPSHLDYMNLLREHRIIVNKLAAILRVADALDRGHAQQVRNLEFERTPEELVIYIRGVSDLTLERRAIVEKANLFEETYGLKVRLEESAAAELEKRAAWPLE